MCLSPLTIRYKPKRLSQRIYDTQFIQVPCGNCPDCLEFRIAQRICALLCELQTSHICSFATLTYDEQHFNKFGVNKADLKPLIDECRKRNIKITISSEYGSHTDRPHYHLTAFCSNHTLCDILEKCWKFGNYQSRMADLASIRYTSNSHITKQSHIPEFVDSETGEIFLANSAFTYSSRGIGYDFVDLNSKLLFNSGFVVKLQNMTFKLPDNLQNRVLKNTLRTSFAIFEYKRIRAKMTQKKRDMEDYIETLRTKIGLSQNTPPLDVFNYYCNIYMKTRQSAFRQRYVDKVNTNQI